MDYLQFNVLLLALILLFVRTINREWPSWRATRAAVFVTLLAFPWDFFAVSNAVWAYSEPGVRAYGVPVNDSLFIFTCSLLTCSLLDRWVLVSKEGREVAKVSNSGLSSTGGSSRG